MEQTDTEIFLSTPSARRATKLPTLSSDWIKISIHALREEGDEQAAEDLHRVHISIHALREEGDGMGHVVIAAAE